MKLQAHLIYKSEFTCFPTSLPVYFYGLPNGKVILLFAQSDADFAFDTSLKWFLAEHIDFSYDYHSGTILTEDFQEVGIDEFMELADNLEQRVIVLATFGNFLNKSEALQYFKSNVENMLLSCEFVKPEICYY